MSRPFQPIKDPEAASSQDAQRLYDQASSVSTIAYLLLGAAIPLSTARGSSASLLPHLTPPTLRIYASQPRLCSSSLVAQLYGLSQSLYGSTGLQACHYDLYKAIRATFGWVASSIPLRLQRLPQQPQATAAWPDLSTLPDSDLAAAVTAALLSQPELAEAAALLSESCGLDIPTFSSLVPSISSAMTQLHADLAELQTIDEERLAASSPRQATQRQRQVLSGNAAGSRGQGRRRRRIREVSGVDESHPGMRPEAEAEVDFGALSAWGSEQGWEGDTGNDVDDITDRKRDEEMRLEVARRALQQALSPDFVYSMPPAGFPVQPPSAVPKVLIGLVFHVMLYRDGDVIGPVGYDQAHVYVQRMVQIANFMARPTNITFFVKEVRNDPAVHPYLLTKNRKAWLALVDAYCVAKTCLDKSDLVPTTVVDFPRSVNIYVASDASATRGVVGYTYTPGSEFIPNQGFVVITWDQLSVDGANSVLQYNDGVTTLVHEVFHFLGLGHPFQSPPLINCTDSDDVFDTPVVNGSLFGNKFYPTVEAYCMEVFWGLYEGDWEATYQRWSTTLGIPDLDKNAWADSCPKAPGYDELGNFMSYSSSVCFAALGHFTPGQAQRVHYVASELNPVMYAWGQYYAAAQAAPPPQQSLPPEPVNNTCRMTAKSACPCKSLWRFNKKQFSYCDRTGGVNRLTCAVADPASCPDCSPAAGQCILPCDGTPQMCKKPPAPGVRLPPPPPPLPPSLPPMPPPPPPLAIPADCKVSASNCACRSSWAYNLMSGSYCSLYHNSTRQLWCVVTPSCPNFLDSPLQPCRPNMAPGYCNGAATPLPPPPAPPPTSPPPTSPPPTSPPPTSPSRGTPKRPRRPR